MFWTSRGLDAGLIDLLLGEGNLHAQGLGRLEQPRGMFLQLVDRAAVDALALEHAGAIMQAMGEHMGLGVLPGHQLAVIPKLAIALVERDHVCHDFAILTGLARLRGEGLRFCPAPSVLQHGGRENRKGWQGLFRPRRRTWQP